MLAPLLVAAMKQTPVGHANTHSMQNLTEMGVRQVELDQAPWHDTVPFKRTFYGDNSKITEFEMIDTKNSSTAYVVMYKLIT